ncbi:MAG TPA: nitroreductase family protein [bacterium]|nr:nitroreductase family protein [bacterium]
MEVVEAVRTVLAVRSYQNKPVPADVVTRIVEAGRLTGSSRNGQPWQFVVVQDREMLSKLGAASPTGPYIAQAPMAIAVAIEKASRFGVSDGSRAIQSMMLTAWADGVASNWVGFAGMSAAKSLLGIPDEYDLLAIVPFGYPVTPGGRGKKKRKSLSQVASRERYGRPFA